MKTVELFSGTASFSKVAKERGHMTFTVDNDDRHHPHKVLDITVCSIGEIFDMIRYADVVWMSPPCQTFSMAAGNKHWTADRRPKTAEANIAAKLLSRCRIIANHCTNNEKLFFIENPVARARWFLPKEWRKTVWYCQYGDTRAKPTDIWTNLEGWEPKTCRNGNPDCHHERAPRGSKTGTQGLKGAKERGVIPPALFHEIFDIIESRR